MKHGETANIMYFLIVKSEIVHTSRLEGLESFDDVAFRFKELMMLRSVDTEKVVYPKNSVKCRMNVFKKGKSFFEISTTVKSQEEETICVIVILIKLIGLSQICQSFFMMTLLIVEERGTLQVFK
jgi:hypothetical protein